MTDTQEMFYLKPDLPGLCSGDARLWPGYAYLIRSGVPMGELYPWLGELLFSSRVVDNKGETAGLNLVGLFIDDSPDNMFRNLDEGYFGVDNPMGVFLDDYKPEIAFAAWLDTFGQADIGRETRMEGLPEGYEWLGRSLRGAGNPMQVFRFLKQIERLPVRGHLNLFLLSSLSNLHRNLGLQETAALLKASLDQTIWRAEELPAKDCLANRRGLFFAVLQRGVMSAEEEEYLASFFDGIIDVDPVSRPREGGGRVRLPCCRVESLPKHEEFDDPHLYRLLSEKPLTGVELGTSKKRRFISLHMHPEPDKAKK